jgi:hypothetical protein
MAEEIKRPKAGINVAARLAELRRKQRQAALRDDWAAADRYEMQVRKLEAERAAERTRQGGQ